MFLRTRCKKSAAYLVTSGSTAWASLPYHTMGRSKFRRCMRAAAIESESRRRSGDCGVPPHTMSPTNPIVMDSFNPLTIHSLLRLSVSSMDGAGSVTNILLLEDSSCPRSRSLQAHTHTHTHTHIHTSDSSELNRQTDRRGRGVYSILYSR
jgi:hypothetical protein